MQLKKRELLRFKKLIAPPILKLVQFVKVVLIPRKFELIFSLDLIMSEDPCFEVKPLNEESIIFISKTTVITELSNQSLRE